MNTDELSALRWPLLLLLLVLIVGGVAVYRTNLMWQQATTELTRRQVQLRDAQTRMRRSGDEKTIIVEYVDEYRRLQRSGFIGNEQRINWLDALRLANERADLFGVNYEIGVQQGYPFASELDPGQIALRQSVMKLNFQLLHEGDLLRFLNLLRAQGTGLFHIDQCALRRIGATDALRYQPNITASCQLAWITATPGGRP